MNNNGIQKFMGCLILLVGWLLAYLLWVSIGWSESEDWKEKAVKYIIILLIPLSLGIGISLIQSVNPRTQSLGLGEKKSSKSKDDKNQRMP